MAEFAPALVVLLIFIFFPVLDLMTVCFDYAAVMVLNFNQVHEAALIPSDQANDPAGTVKKSIVEQWQGGIGRFARVSGSPRTVVTYRDGAKAGSDETPDKIVTLQTTVVCIPFLEIPIPGAQIPGLNMPITLSVSSDLPMESADNAPH